MRFQKAVAINQINIGRINLATEYYRIAKGQQQSTFCLIHIFT
jgi:hypothetical protein